MKIRENDHALCIRVICRASGPEMCKHIIKYIIIIFSSVVLDTLLSKYSEEYRLSPERELKMVGYWPRSFLHVYQFIDRDVVEILNTKKRIKCSMSKPVNFPGAR